MTIATDPRTMTQPLTDDLPDTRPGSIPDAEPDARPRAKLLDLSLTQLLGGSMAAATAAALGSRLGVVGTIAGAAVLSIISATAASLYTNSMARAREAVVLVRSRRGPDGVDVEVVRETWWRRPDRATARRVLVTTGAVFAIAAAFLSGLQLATGARVTGTDLGGRSSAGAVIESPAGTTGGSAGDSTSTDTGAVDTTPSARATTTGTTAPAGSTSGQATSTGTPSAMTPATPATPANRATPGGTTVSADPTAPTTPATPDPGASTPSDPATAP